MEAKLKNAEFDCFKKSYSLNQRKEESRDAVVPDTQPDISEVLFCGTKVLIRSKDVSAGRVRTEASVNANVLYRGEDGKVWTMEFSLPFFFSAEDERISSGGVALAKLNLLSAEAIALNPRKILLRAEMEAELSVYESNKLSYCESIEDEEHIHCRIGFRECSIISAVTEKTFPVSDEISLPPAAGNSKGVICLGVDSCVDETKTVGSKLIIKGKIKSRLIIINDEGEICRIEPVSDFSQIVELGGELLAGPSLVWLNPSGAYCGISQENEGRIVLEYHMVAQLIYRSNVSMSFVDEVYSNCHEIIAEREELEAELIWDKGREKESSRQLYETSRPVSEVLYSYIVPSKPIFDGTKMSLPYLFSAICRGEDGIWSERHRGTIVFRIPGEEGEYSLKSIEIIDWAALPVPGGMELRIEVAAELILRMEDKISIVSHISYDEDVLKDNSEKPSLVLLRINREDELWSVARENCSCVEAIMSANCFESVSDAVGKLILIPKTN